MEPHSDKKGRLGDKFEAFSHEPKADVWARIESDVQVQRKFALIFATFTWRPNPRVWSKIAAELNGTNASRFAALWWSAAAGIALLIGLGFYAMNGSTDLPFSAQTFAGKMRQWKRSIKNEIHGENFPLDEGKSMSQTASYAAIQKRESFNKHVEAKSSKTPTAPEFGLVNKNDNLESKGIQNLIALEAQKVREVYEADKSWQPALDAQRRMQIEEEIAKQLNLGTEFGSENALASMNNPFSIRVGGNATGAGPGLTKPIFADAFHSNGVQNGLSSGFQELSLDPKFNQEEFKSPIIVGGFVNRNLRKRLDLGLGLVYTRMQSEIQEYFNGSSTKEDITRQYLGLASNVYYNFIEKKKLNLYLTAGAQYDLGIGKESVLNTYSPYEVLEEQRTKSQSGNQLGFNAGTGLNLMFSKHLGAYMQGTVASYPFQTKPNQYTTKVLWPVAQAGLRLKL